MYTPNSAKGINALLETKTTGSENIAFGINAFYSPLPHQFVLKRKAIGAEPDPVETVRKISRPPLPSELKGRRREE